MSKPNKSFLAALTSLPLSRFILALCLFLLAFLYPGHNFLQSQILHPSKVLSYSLPTPNLTIYPISDGVSVPSTSARAVIVQDVGSKSLLYAKNPDTLLLPASTTKIMTALVARNTWGDLSTPLTVVNEDRAIGQTIKLVKGEQLSVESLLKGILIHSGNDAALALADNYDGGYPAFVAAMNVQAKDLHLEHTVYKNPSGIEQYGHVTTARDLATLASVAMADPVLRDIVATRYTVISDITGTIKHPLVTTNELLGEIEGLSGLKTGWTENAGECLVSYVERDGRGIIVVVLGSLDRFGDTRRLIDWVYAHHTWGNVDTSL